MSINKITDCHPGLYDKIVETKKNKQGYYDLNLSAQIECDENIDENNAKLCLDIPIPGKIIEYTKTEFNIKSFNKWSSPYSPTYDENSNSQIFNIFQDATVPSAKEEGELSLSLLNFPTFVTRVVYGHSGGDTPNYYIYVDKNIPLTYLTNTVEVKNQKFQRPIHFSIEQNYFGQKGIAPISGSSVLFLSGINGAELRNLDKEKFFTTIFGVNWKNNIHPVNVNNYYAMFEFCPIEEKYKPKFI